MSDGVGLMPDFHQIQPLRRCRRAGHFSILGLQDFSDVARRSFSASNLKESSYNIANHMMKEAVGLNAVGHMVSTLLNLGEVDVAGPALDLRACCSKSREIMGVTQLPGSFLHGRKVQRMPHMEDVAVEEWGQRGAGVDPVFIALPGGILLGMKA